MATLPKVSKRIVSVNTTTSINYMRGVSSTQDYSEPEYVVDGRNRKERRQAGASKKRPRSVDAPQRGIYNAFRGY